MLHLLSGVYLIVLVVQWLVSLPKESPCTCVHFLQDLQNPEAIGVNVCVLLCWTCELCGVYPASHPVRVGRCSASANPKLDK